MEEVEETIASGRLQIAAVLLRSLQGDPE